jgi:hypothetical protein
MKIEPVAYMTKRGAVYSGKPSETDTPLYGPEVIEVIASLQAKIDEALTALRHSTGSSDSEHRALGNVRKILEDK